MLKICYQKHKVILIDFDELLNKFLTPNRTWLSNLFYEEFLKIIYTPLLLEFKFSTDFKTEEGKKLFGNLLDKVSLVQLNVCDSMAANSNLNWKYKISPKPKSEMYCK